MSIDGGTLQITQGREYYIYRCGKLIDVVQDRINNLEKRYQNIHQIIKENIVGGPFTKQYTKIIKKELENILNNIRTKEEAINEAENAVTNEKENEEPKEETVNDEPKEEPKEETVNDEPKEEPKEDEPKEEPKEDEPKEETVNDETENNYVAYVVNDYVQYFMLIERNMKADITSTEFYEALQNTVKTRFNKDFGETISKILMENYFPSHDEIKNKYLSS